MVKSMKKYFNKIPYFIFILGIIMDIGVNLTGIYCIPVTESYMDYIFAGIITVSVLCFSFVALISGFLEKSYFGYKLRDIMQFPESPINLKKYIHISLLTIVIGVCLLIGNFKVCCVNSLTTLLLAVVCLEGNVASKVYDILTSEKYVCDLVISHFSRSVKEKCMDFEEFYVHTNKIIGALKDCIDKKDFEGKDKICEMLTELGGQIQKKEGKEDYYKYYNYFNDKIRGCINDFSMVFGFNEMMNAVVKIYTRLSNFEYGRIDLYVLPLKNIRFWNDQSLLERNYFIQIAEIDLLEAYKKKDISNSEVEKILYEYFFSIMRNCICTIGVREQLIETYVTELMKLHWKTNEKGVEPDVNSLLNILKYFVLKNDNVEERNYVFKVIVKSAFYNRNPYEKEKFFDFLALFFQSCYAYIFCEGETLNERYREELKETFALEFSSETIVKMSASWLLRMNIQGILLAIGRRIINDQTSLERRFENFPTYPMAKSVVWTREYNIDFLFMLYLIFNDEVGFYSIYMGFLDWNHTNTDCKNLILDELQNKFDLETGLLKEEFVLQCKQYATLLKHSRNITEQMQKKIFEHIIDENKKLKQRKFDNQEMPCLNMNYDDVMKKINDIMKKERIFGWNPDYATDTYVKFVIPDCISRREYRTTQSTARTIQKGIVDAVQRYIQQCSSKLELSFDLNGVKNLLEFIKEKNYNARNYTFTDDWAVAKLRQEIDFIKLEEQQQTIELVNTPAFYEHIFFIKEKFCFNAKISKIEFEDLNDRECAEFLENSKCYNGLYNVDGALLAKEEAMRCVKKLYCKERYCFKLLIGLNRNDVTTIKFVH